MYGKMITSAEEARIKRLRASGMTVLAVAAACGVSPSTIGKVTSGRRHGPRMNVEAAIIRRRK